MSAPHVFVVCVLFTVLLSAIPASSSAVRGDKPGNPGSPGNDGFDKKIELFDGVAVQFPKDNSTGRLMSLEIDTGKAVEEGRGSKSSKNKKVLERILPMFIMPFLIQSTIVPFFLSMLKFMLFKSLMVGKLAMGLILLNAFKNHNTSKGRNDVELSNAHYGYHDNGMEEATSYFNHKY